MTRPGFEPQSSRPLANTLFIKPMAWYIEKYLIFYISKVHTNSFKKKEYTNVSQQLKIYTCCAMNKQYAKRYKNGKSLLDKIR